MDRRDFLRLALVTAASSALPTFPRIARASGGSAGATFFVPGNYQKSLFLEGAPLLEHPRLARDMRPFEGHPTLLTRLAEHDRSVTRAVLPVAGHDISVKRDGSSAVCNGQNATTMCSFDPTTLDMGAFIEYPEGRVGGGHSVYLPDERTMVVTERVPYARYTGNPRDHYGFLSIRDNETLKQVEQFSCGGITPHDISLLEDGAHVAVSNYGSTSWPEGSIGYDNYLVEPSLCVIEVASGKIVDRYVPETRGGEYRHLAARNRQRIFVIQNAEMSIAAYHEMMKQGDEPYRPKLQKQPESVGASLPVVQLDFESGGPPAKLVGTPDPKRMLRGQSITYDAENDEALATFPLSDSVVAISGKTGETRVIDCSALGLDSPRGIDMLADGKHYAVAGDEGNVFVFECGTHRLIRERCFYTKLYRHSHMTAA